MTKSPQSAADHRMGPTGPVRLLLSTAPPDKAHLLGRALVEERLAACVNLLPGVRSVYRWQGAMADDPETLILIKTHADRIEDLARRLGELHPYEVPELVCLTPESGLSAYFDWVRAEVVEPPPRA